MKSIKSSSGGTIVFSEGGLIHIPAKGAYSGRLAEEGLEATTYDVAKRGRGRPRKDGGVKYDFSAFLNNVKVPEWKGASRVYTQKDED